MYQQFSLTSKIHEQIEIVSLAGYLEETGGIELKSHIQSSLDNGTTLFGFDCSKIELISSPGVASLLDVAGFIIDDFMGRLAIWGLDKHHSTVLEMSGFFFLAQAFSNQQEVIEFLRSE